MSDLRPEDRGWIEAIQRELRPEPMDARRALAFRRELEERLARRDLRRRLVWPTLASAVAAAALALWLVQPAVTTPNGVRSGATEVADVDAFVDPDAGAGELGAAEDYLPGDYLVLAGLLEDPEP
jgi:hypothetical protein